MKTIKGCLQALFVLVLFGMLALCEGAARAQSSEGFVSTTALLDSPVIADVGLKSEFYTNIWGPTLVDLTNNAHFPNSPDKVGVIPDFEAPSQFGESYGARFSGYLLPPVTGFYTFYIAADDQSALFLSTDENPLNKKQIAIESSWAFPRSWIDCASRTNRANISDPIYLEAGHAYYIEALHKQMMGGDCLGVAWRKPGDPELVNGDPPISGEYLRVTPPVLMTTVYVTTSRPRYEPGANITLFAGVDDPQGEVVQVEFFFGEQSLGIATNQTSPLPEPVLTTAFPIRPAYSMTWSNVSAGQYELTAVATDSLGLTATSAPVHVVVAEIPVVTIVATTPTTQEPSDGTTIPGAFTVYRTGPTDNPLIVAYDIGGTAENGVDYQPLLQSVTIPAGQSNAMIEVAPVNDGLIELTETVELTLLEPPIIIPMVLTSPVVGSVPYKIGEPSSAVVQIVDRPRPPVVTITSPTNNALIPYAAQVPIKAVVSGGDPAAIKAVEFFVDGKSLGVDLTPDPIVTSIVDGPLGPRYGLVWSNPSAGAHMLTAVAVLANFTSCTSAPVAIVVSSIPRVSVIAVDSYGAERTANGTAKPAVFNVRRTGATDSDLLVWYSIYGTASNGVDYVQIQNAVNIPAGARSADITIVPLQDNLVEGDETVIIKLEYSPLASPEMQYEVGSSSIAAAVIADSGNVIEPAGPPQFVDGKVHLHFAGQNGQAYQLEVSTNLVDWTSVAQAIACSGAVGYVDAQAGQSQSKFYRIRPVTDSVLLRDE